MKAAATADDSLSSTQHRDHPRVENHDAPEPQGKAAMPGRRQGEYSRTEHQRLNSEHPHQGQSERGLGRGKRTSDHSGKQRSTEAQGYGRHPGDRLTEPPPSQGHERRQFQNEGEAEPAQG